MKLLEELANEVVESTLDELPPEIANAVAGVSIFVEGQPGAEDVQSGIGSDWLGVFEGAAFGQSDRIHPPRIRIWIENIWLHSSGRKARFCEEVRKTLLHEIGHYLGWDEIDVRRRGLE